MVTKRLFGSVGGRQVYAYTLKGERLEVTVINYGATIQSIKFDGRELVLGYDNIDGYVTTTDYFGATIGRVANRISGGKFTLGGRKYSLDLNDGGKNSLHGGFRGYDKRVFYGEDNGEEVRFSILSKDGDQGMPANLVFKVVYAIEGDTLKVSYSADTSGETLWNPTNHSFFNLSGTNSSALGTLVKINAHRYTPIDETSVPTGKIADVKDTPFDFTEFKQIGRDITADDEQLKLASGGYDHNFVLDGEYAASAKCDGVRMDVYTDMPGLQFYTANFLNNTRCRGGAYDARSAFCFEPQYFPDAINKEGFEKPVICAGRTHRHYIRYHFSSEE